MWLTVGVTMMGILLHFCSIFFSSSESSPPGQVRGRERRQRSNRSESEGAPDEQPSGLHQNPSRSNRAADSLSSPTHLIASVSCCNPSMTALATAGLGNASAHDAQYAAWAHLWADLKPSPPIRIGRLAT